MVRMRGFCRVILLVAVSILLSRSLLYADPPSRFLYGVWGNAFSAAVDSSSHALSGLAAFTAAGTGNFSLEMSILQDTLGFNMAHNEVWNAATAESLIARGFKVVEFDSSYEPGKPSDFAESWYLVWQSDTTSIPSWYQGSQYQAPQGSRIVDNGDTVWVVGGEYGGSRGLMVQTGGSNYQVKDSKFGAPQQQLDFRLKAANVSPVDTVAAVYAVITENPNDPQAYTTVAADTLYGSEFTSGVYTPKLLTWTQSGTQGSTIWAYYSVYWFGRGVLYFDEVLSSDELGQTVIAGLKDQNIDDYTTTFTYGTDGSYLLGWYLLDEESTPETNTCWEHVNQRLRQGTGNKGGFQQWSYPLSAYAATKMTTPKYLMCIDYLARGSHCDNGVIDDAGAVSFSTDSPGGDSVSLQVAFDLATPRFRQYKQWADSSGLIFWPLIGSFRWSDSCGQICYDQLRRPSGYELRAHAGLALAYGAEALGYFRWGQQNCYVDGIYPGSPGFDDIRTLVSPFIDSLGDLFYDLKWLGADSSQSAASVSGSFIDSIRSFTFPTRPYVEAAFFKDTATQDDYFMLVNRRCLAAETQSVCCWLDRSPGMYYVIDKYSYDSILTGSMSNGAIPFTTTLGPGESKLFKIISVGTSTVAGHTLPGAIPKLVEV